MRRLFQGENETYTEEATEICREVVSFMNTILKKYEEVSTHDIEVVIINEMGLACACARLERALELHKAKKEGRNV